MSAVDTRADRLASLAALLFALVSAVALCGVRVL